MQNRQEIERIENQIFTLILEERKRQAEKWNKNHSWGFGDCSNDGVEAITKSAVLSEECGEVAKAVLEKNGQELKKELVQVAAVCVAWLTNVISNELSRDSSEQI